MMDKNLIETRPLSDAEFEAIAKPQLEKIFSPGTLNPLEMRFVDQGWPRFVTFSEDIDFITILYSCFLPVLEHTNAPGFFVTVNGYISKNNPDYPYHWFISGADLPSLLSPVAQFGFLPIQLAVTGAVMVD